MPRSQVQNIPCNQGGDPPRWLQTWQPNDRLGGMSTLFLTVDLRISLRTPRLKLEGDKLEEKKSERVLIGEPPSDTIYCTDFYGRHSGLLPRDKSVHTPDVGETWHISLVLFVARNTAAVEDPA